MTFCPIFGGCRSRFGGNEAGRWPDRSRREGGTIRKMVGDLINRKSAGYENYEKKLNKTVGMLVIIYDC